MSAIALRIKKKISYYLAVAFSYMPGGYLCRIQVNKERVTLRRNGWVTIDSGPNTAKDSLPVNFISEGMVKKLQARMVDIGYKC